MIGALLKAGAKVGAKALAGSAAVEGVSDAITGENPTIEDRFEHMEDVARAAMGRMEDNTDAVGKFTDFATVAGAPLKAAQQAGAAVVSSGIRSAVPTVESALSEASQISDEADGFGGGSGESFGEKADGFGGGSGKSFGEKAGPALNAGDQAAYDAKHLGDIFKAGMDKAAGLGLDDTAALYVTNKLTNSALSSAQGTMGQAVSKVAVPTVQAAQLSANTAGSVLKRPGGK